MKSLSFIILLMLSASSFASWKTEAKNLLREYNAECRSVEINVESIVRDNFISGVVKGLPQEALEKFKMIFYVRTNRWYIHPYLHHEGQEEGYSYSNLSPQGEFKIRTVRRTPSRQLAAILVPKQVPIGAQALWLKPLLGLFGGLTKYSCQHRLVKGSGDFFH
jgi:hypothetical protein